VPNSICLRIGRLSSEPGAFCTKDSSGSRDSRSRREPRLEVLYGCAEAPQFAQRSAFHKAAPCATR
jgi:hypothetical protein